MNTLSKAVSALTLALAVAAPLAAHAATNLVANGSFEQNPFDGGFDGWTVSLGDPATFVDQGDASAGLWSVYFGTTAAAGGSTISQALATSAGQQYVLSFELANDNAGGNAANAFTASVGGATVYSVATLADQGYALETVTFTAAGASTLLSFSAFNDVGYVQLDDVSVTAAPVPEPAPAALLLAGLAAAGAVRRKRRA